MSSGSLTDKYNKYKIAKTRDAEAKDIEEAKENAYLDTVKDLEQYGFSVNHDFYLTRYDTEALYLSSSSKELILEAINLIQPSKWKEAPLYNKRDIHILDEKVKAFGYDGFVGKQYVLSFSFAQDSSYIKYIWPDGTIHCIRVHISRDFFYQYSNNMSIQFTPGVFAEKKHAKAAQAEMISKVNRIQHIQTIKYGSQKYVMLPYKYKVYHDYHCSWNTFYLVLFQDCYLFDPFGLPVRRKLMKETTNKILAVDSIDEAWLFEALRIVNGDVPSTNYLPERPPF